MGCFRAEELNQAFAVGIMDKIVAHLIRFSDQMKNECSSNGKLLKNNEDAITNRLVEQYLNPGQKDFHYEAQAPENFDDEIDCYIGRIDIKVFSRDIFRDAHQYHIVECKRIDGTTELNQKYITEGVERFFSPSPKPKYSSYYRQNIMFGYVVQAIRIPDNAEKIDRLQATLLKGAKASKFILKQSEVPQSYIYTCIYISENIGEIALNHLFFDFADAICNK